MANYYGSWVETKGGKFRLKITTSYTDAGIVWTPIIDVNNAFDSAVSFKLTYTNASGTDKTYKTLANGNTTIKKVQEAKFSARTWPSYKIPKKISLTINSKTSSIAASTIVSTNKPPAPNISVTHPVSSRFDITVSGKGSTSQPVQKIYLERADTANPATSDWEQIKYESITAVTDEGTYSYTFNDTDIDEGKVYRYRARVSGSKTGSEIFSSYVTDPNSHYTSPGQGDTPGTSEQGDSIVISWTASIADIDSGVVQGFYVLRSTDGGSYTRIATVMASTSRTQYSYTDSSRYAGHTYKYAIQPFGSGGASPTPTEGGDEYTTKPTAPTRVDAYRGANDTVVIVINGTSAVAESVHIERSIDGGSWTQIAEEDYPLTEYTDTTATASDNIVYRVRYSNDTGYSTYTQSNAVMVKQPPNPPTLLYPYADAVMPLDTSTIRMSWKHNPKDGSPQSNAEHQYKIGSGSWVSHYTNENASYDLNISGMSPNDVITWRVRTKGAHVNYSSFSGEQSFTLVARPELTITSPENDDVISELPINIEFDYSDQSGTLKELYVDIMQKDVLKTFEFDVGSGSSGHYSYTLGGYLFDNEAGYTLRVRALSTSGLWTEDIISVTINYEDVSLEGGLLPVVDCDQETGYAIITILRDITESEQGIVPEPIPIAEAYLYRVHDRERELIATVYEGVQITDKYAPINVEYYYELLLLTVAGQVSIVRIMAECDSKSAFIYYGDKITKLDTGVTQKTNLGRPEKKNVRYSGRHHGVSYDSEARSQRVTIGAVVLQDRDRYLDFVEMMNAYGGQGIYKSLNGDVFYADFECEIDEDQCRIEQKWSIEITAERIERPDDD